MTFLRMTAALIAFGLLPVWARGASPETFYYLGEVKLSSATGQPIGSQALMLEKTHDPDNATIIERAIVVHPDGKVEERMMRLSVKDDNSFTLVDDAKTVKGTGKLFGPAWRWTYFKATFLAENGVRIDDENFMTDNSAATARKKVTRPDGNVIMYMETTVKSITPKTFKILEAGLLKKAKSPAPAAP